MRPKVNNSGEDKKRKMVKLQIPMPKSLREEAEKQAEQQGFGSVQDAVRLFLAGFVKGEYYVGFSAGEKKEDS